MKRILFGVVFSSGFSPVFAAQKNDQFFNVCMPEQGICQVRDSQKHTEMLDRIKTALRDKKDKVMRGTKIIYYDGTDKRPCIVDVPDLSMFEQWDECQELIKKGEYSWNKDKRTIIVGRNRPKSAL